MLDFHEASDDVLAVTVMERITSADLETLIETIEDRLARFPTVHVFAEVRAVGGLDFSGLGSHVARAMPLLGRLGQFGRVAVVADQAWIRGLTRLESAILPFISYRVFEPAQSAEALAWVKGRSIAGT